MNQSQNDRESTKLTSGSYEPRDAFDLSRDG